MCPLFSHRDIVSIAEPIRAMINSSNVKQSVSSGLELWYTDFFPLWKQEPLVHCMCGACVVDWICCFIVHKYAGMESVLCSGMPYSGYVNKLEHIKHTTSFTQICHGTCMEHM